MGECRQGDFVLGCSGWTGRSGIVPVWAEECFVCVVGGWGGGGQVSELTVDTRDGCGWQQLVCARERG